MTTAPRRRSVGVTPMENRADVVLHLAGRAEELGYESFSVAEGWGHDAAVLLATIAARTERIGLATGVLNVWGRSPAGIAMLAGSLAEASGGRFALGLGAGSPQLAEGLHGQRFEAPVARLGSVTRQVRSLLAGGRVTPTVPGGQRPLRLAVPPHPEVPVHLAGLGPRSVRLAGELADAWCPFFLPRSGLADGVKQVQEGAIAADRPLPSVRPGLPVAVAADPAVAEAVAAWWVVTYLTGMGPLYAGTLRRLGLGAAVDAVVAANPAPRSPVLPPEARVLVDEVLVAGDAAAARSAVDAWTAAGADVPGIVLPPGRPVEELEYALEVLRP
ncbi:LLM class flavin-dependent oxidoreductase [Blastococcus sp. SYSU D00813]